MTRPSNDELKRLAEGAKERAALLRRLDALSEVADALDAMAGGTLSALSEIEGLKVAVVELRDGLLASRNDICVEDWIELCDAALSHLSAAEDE